MATHPGNGQERALRASVASIERSIGVMRAEVDSLMANDPERAREIALKIADEVDTKASLSIELVFGDVEVLEDAPEEDAVIPPAATAANPSTDSWVPLGKPKGPDPVERYDDRNHYEDGVPLAHNTLFADADQS